MRIAEVVVRFHPYVGGVEQTVYQLGTRLVQRGHQVDVICAAEPPEPSEVDGISVTRLPYMGKVGETNLALGLVRAIRAKEPDLIHTHMPTAWFADAAAHASGTEDVPLVLSYNNDLIGTSLKGVLALIYNRFFLPRLLSKATSIVVPNPAYSSYSPFLSRFSDRIENIPWGVDDAKFRPAPLPTSEPFTLCFLSILDSQHHYKGLRQLLLAFGHLRDKGRRFHLRVGGSGDQREYYEQLAVELGVSDNVSFLGFVPDDDLLDFFHSCHLFVLPSTDFRQEGFGLVLLEAMASGRPVLTTSIVGMAHDIARHNTGLVVPPDDVNALVSALETAAADIKSLNEMAVNATQMVNLYYTWDRVTNAYESLFRRSLPPSPAETL